MTVDEAELEALAQSLGQVLQRHSLRLATAESCTGGWIAQCVTAVPGSSAWFDRGFVTYSNTAKSEMLGVAPELIERHGAVSEPVVLAMAAGALGRSRAEVAVAVSGVAGPTGGSPAKPVGTVWFAWQRAGRGAVTRRCLLAGDRRAVRGQAVAIAVQGLLAVCDG